MASPMRIASSGYSRPPTPPAKRPNVLYLESVKQKTRKRTAILASSASHAAAGSGPSRSGDIGVWEPVSDAGWTLRGVWEPASETRDEGTESTSEISDGKEDSVSLSNAELSESEVGVRVPSLSESEVGLAPTQVAQDARRRVLCSPDAQLGRVDALDGEVSERVSGLVTHSGEPLNVLVQPSGSAALGRPLPVLPRQVEEHGSADLARRVADVRVKRGEAYAVDVGVLGEEEVTVEGKGVEGVGRGADNVRVHQAVVVS
ncbi:hypothetical protein CRV24_009360 [Beauveria bassiana]|nr:hypothetical protein CRV24_009360 [Beauveria bassiana]KAH8707255.1 hypothetical protein HC256_010532 [Beauveria bassiana]